MTPALPPYDPAQLEAARLRSLERRAARAELKQLVHDGRLSVRDLLIRGARGSSDEVAKRMEIGDVLLSVNGIGPKTAVKILAVLPSTVVESDHLDVLTAAEREALATMIEELQGG